MMKKSSIIQSRVLAFYDCYYENCLRYIYNLFENGLSTNFSLYPRMEIKIREFMAKLRQEYLPLLEENTRERSVSFTQHDTQFICFVVAYAKQLIAESA